MSTITADILKQIDSIDVMTDRVKKRRNEVFSGERHICIDRSHIATESYKETEGQHLYMRRAKLFAKICDEIPIAIFDQELIVGSQTQFLHGAWPQIDWSIEGVTELEAGRRSTRASQALAKISDTDIATLVADAEYWKGKTPSERTYEAIRAVVGRLYPGVDFTDLENAGITEVWGTDVPWYRVADYSKIINRGIRGIIKDIDIESSKIEFTSLQDTEKWYFLQAAKISCEAIIRYAKRYSKLATELALKEKDSNRKAELEHISEICDRVPENPARSFEEALQSIWLILLGLDLETGHGCELLGRMDQYLYPFYHKDVSEGNINHERAAELLACFLIKCGTMHRFWSGKDMMTAIEGAHQIKLVVGGVDREGNDASNELSYLLLHVAGYVKLHEPALYMRWHRKCPRELMVKAAWSQREHGGGSPAFQNDEHTIPCLVAEGASIEDARDYYIAGCSHPFPYGSAYTRAHPQINGAKVFELVLYNGFDPRTKKQLGLKTGDPRTFTSIEDWLEAWKKQWEYLYSVLTMISRVGKNTQLEYYDVPFASAVHVDCVANGHTISRGGCRYPQFLQNPGIRVYADVADSLTAIKKLVYEDKKLTVDDILKVCANNYEGKLGEHTRDMLRAAPKYGNDTEDADDMYRNLQAWVLNLVRSSKGYLGFNCYYQGLGAALHFRHGLYTGALPNGRKAGAPLADGAISPVAGCDTKGITATLASAGKLMDWGCVNSAIFNQKMPRSLLKTTDKLERFVDLIETFFEVYNPYQIQWNIQDASVYKAAKENPQDYKDLIVRVGGYSAYFVELAPVLQDEIIARTEQGL